MTYSPVEVGERHHAGRAPDMRKVFQCCGLVMFQAPQAQYHLWREHGGSAAEAWAIVEGLSSGVQVPIVDDGNGDGGMAAAEVSRILGA